MEDDDEKENEMNLYIFAISLVLYSTFLFLCEMNEETKKQKKEENEKHSCPTFYYTKVSWAKENNSMKTDLCLGASLNQ